MKDEWPKEVLEKVSPLINSVRKRRIRETEKEIIKLLEEIITRYPSKPTKENEVREQDYLLVKFLWVGFDDYFYEEEFSKRVPTTPRNTHNRYLLSCCHYPEFMDRLLVEILNYLTWNEPYYYEQKELLQALKDYQEKRKTSILAKKAPRH